jgi:hypothetical protein
MNDSRWIFADLRSARQELIATSRLDAKAQKCAMAPEQTRLIIKWLMRAEKDYRDLCAKAFPVNRELP